MRHERPAARFIAALAAGEDPSSAMGSVLVAAHPDDETVGLGAQLPRLRSLTILTVTDGAPRALHDAASHGFETSAAYAEARRRELREALAMAGIGPERISSLDVHDQAASLQLAPLARRLAALLGEAHVVITHSYEGGHPDHDAVAFAVHSARALLARSGALAPDIVEMSSYHSCDGEIATYAFLPRVGVEETAFELSEADRALKRGMFDRFATQRRTLDWFPIERELLRPAPDYRFTAPPHAGTLFYDRFDWGMRSEHWRGLAATALAELDLAEPL